MTRCRWRYECDECGSIQVVRRMTHNYRGARAGGPWYCRGCSSSQNEVWDKKEGKYV